MYTVSEENMLTSMIVYLEEENKTELSSILQVSKFVYSPQWEFLWVHCIFPYGSGIPVIVYRKKKLTRSAVVL